MLPFLVGLLWAQQTTPDTSDVLKYLGPFVVYAVPTTFWIRDLLSRLKASQQREQLLSDRLVELAERATPALAENTRVLAQVADELRLRERRER